MLFGVHARLMEGEQRERERKKGGQRGNGKD